MQGDCRHHPDAVACSSACDTRRRTLSSPQKTSASLGSSAPRRSSRFCAKLSVASGNQRAPGIRSASTRTRSPGTPSISAYAESSRPELALVLDRPSPQIVLPLNVDVALRADRHQNAVRFACATRDTEGSQSLFIRRQVDRSSATTCSGNVVGRIVASSIHTMCAAPSAYLRPLMWMS